MNLNNISKLKEDIVVFENFLTKEECDAVIKYWDHSVEKGTLMWQPISFYDSFASNLPDDEDKEKYNIPLNFFTELKEKIKEAVALIQQGLNASDIATANNLLQELVQSREPLKRDIFRTVNLILEKIPTHPNAAAIQLFLTNYKKAEAPLYSQHLYNEGPKSALNVSVVEATYAENAPVVNGYEVLNQYFDKLYHDLKSRSFLKLQPLLVVLPVFDLRK